MMMEQFGYDIWLSRETGMKTEVGYDFVFRREASLREPREHK